MTEEKIKLYPAHGLEIGDKITISGVYKRRSFIQWLRRKPKELEIYKTIAKISGGKMEIEK